MIPRRTQAEGVTTPAPGIQEVRNPNPTLNSAPPKFGGWGPAPVSLRKVEPQPPVIASPEVKTFQVSAAGFLQLIEREYAIISAGHGGVSKPPLSFFQYLCTHAWWRRILEVQKSNRDLTSEENRALAAYTNAGPFAVPPRIADYLDSLGNVTLSGEVYQLYFDPFTFSQPTIDSGGFVLFSNSVRLTPDSAYIYTRIPVPGVLWSLMKRDIRRHFGREAYGQDFFSKIRPSVFHFVGAESVQETENLLGWRCRRRSSQPSTFSGGTQSQLGSCGKYISTFLEKWGITSEDGFLGCLDRPTSWLESPRIFRHVEMTLRDMGVELVTTDRLRPVSEGSISQLSFVRVDQELLRKKAGVGDIRSAYLYSYNFELCSGIHIPDELVSLSIGCAFNFEYPNLSLTPRSEALSRTSPFIALRQGHICEPNPEFSGPQNARIPFVSQSPAGHNRPTHRTRAIRRFSIL